MRMVRKKWINHRMPQHMFIDFETALNELKEIFPNCSREIIDKKLSRGTTFGNGKGMTYQILVVSK